MTAIDANILVYFFDVDEPVKQRDSRALAFQLHLSMIPTIIPWQAAVEFVGCLRKWENRKKYTSQQVESAYTQITSLFPIYLPSTDLLPKAFSLKARYSLSHWDSLLLAACIDAGVDTLYTEDLTHGMTYDTVKVINPFVP